MPHTTPAALGSCANHGHNARLRAELPYLYYSKNIDKAVLKDNFVGKLAIFGVRLISVHLSPSQTWLNRIKGKLKVWAASQKEDFYPSPGRELLVAAS